MRTHTDWFRFHSAPPDCFGRGSARAFAPARTACETPAFRKTVKKTGDSKLKPNRFAVAVFCLARVASFAQPPGNAPYLDPNLSPERRAADLVSRLTLQEKALQMQSTAPANRFCFNLESPVFYTVSLNAAAAGTVFTANCDIH